MVPGCAAIWPISGRSALSAQPSALRGRAALSSLLQHGMAFQRQEGNMQKIESTHIHLRTRITRLVRRTICFSKTERLPDLVIGLLINRDAFGVSV
jgi:hypothetical protein